MFHGKRRNLGIVKRNENGERVEGEGSSSVYDQFHGKTVIDRFLDFQTDQQTTLLSIHLPSPLSFFFIRHTYDATEKLYPIPTDLSLDLLDTLPTSLPFLFLFLFFFLSSFYSPLRQIRPKSKRTHRAYLTDLVQIPSRRRKTFLSIRLECFAFSLESGTKKRFGKLHPRRLVAFQLASAIARANLSMELTFRRHREEDDPCAPPHSLFNVTRY